MFAKLEIEALEARRRRLLIESEVNRRELAARLGAVERKLSGADAGMRLWRAARPLLFVLAPAAGYWVASRRKRPSEILDKVARFATMFGKLSRIWAALQAKEGRTSAESGGRVA